MLQSSDKKLLSCAVLRFIYTGRKQFFSSNFVTPTDLCVVGLVTLIQRVVHHNGLFNDFFVVRCGENLCETTECGGALGFVDADRTRRQNFSLLWCLTPVSRTVTLDLLRTYFLVMSLSQLVSMKISIQFYRSLFIPPANEIWGKVICLQACVCPQGGCLVPGGACSERGLVWGGACSWGIWSGGCLVLGGCLLPGGSGPGGMPAPGGAWWRPPTPWMATAAGGTHPTGMHSCYRCRHRSRSLSVWTLHYSLLCFHLDYIYTGSRLQRIERCKRNCSL